MHSGRRHIAVLFHEGDRYLPTHRYIVHYLANFWREDGHNVTFLFGVGRFEAADVVLVHVNLSVVPAEYLEFASRYPISLNGRVADIRKTRVSSNLVAADSEWKGPVIVKSDLNYAGVPEQMLRRSAFERRWRLAHRIRMNFQRWRGTGSPYRAAGDYEIYDDFSKVPRSRIANRQLVIERFLPEREKELYFTRVYQFLGDRWSCTRMGSTDRIVKASNSVRVESVEPHEEVVEWRKRLNMDYGKLDYVIHDGNPVLLDANKVIGASLYAGAKGSISREQISANRRVLAEGIYSFV